jgi:hypothetical protein
MARAPFKLRSGNASAFKNLGSSPAKQVPPSYVEKSSQETKDYFEGTPKKTTPKQKLKAVGVYLKSLGKKSYEESKASVRGTDYRKGKKRPSAEEIRAYSKEQGTYGKSSYQPTTR